MPPPPRRIFTSQPLLEHTLTTCRRICRGGDPPAAGRIDRIFFARGYAGRGLATFCVRLMTRQPAGGAWRIYGGAGRNSFPRVKRTAPRGGVYMMGSAEPRKRPRNRGYLIFAPASPRSTIRCGRRDTRRRLGGFGSGWGCREIWHIPYSGSGNTQGLC